MTIHKQIKAVLVFLFATLLTGCLVFGHAESKDSRITKELSSSLLRFRVLANSDSPEDQQQKESVSSGLVALLSPALSRTAEKSEAVSLIEESLPFLEAYAAYLAEEYGSCTEVTCSLGPHLFPYKVYGDYQFPSGIYDTLLVTIGEGKGSNWWCLAFPPLCFVEDSFLEVPESSALTLESLLSDEAYCEITLNTQKTSRDSSSDTEDAGPEDDDEKKENPVFTFGLFSLVKKIFFDT